MSEEDVKYIDAETYAGGQQDKLTFQIIVLQHLKKISLLASQEFHGGYFKDVTKLISGVGITDHIYVNDTREEYSNAVDYLHDILYCYFDDEMKKESEDNDKELEGLYDKCFFKDEDGKEEFDKQEYRRKKVQIKRKLLRALSAFLMREKYLSAKVFEEEV